ncbi:type IV pilus assembly protein FimV [Microbulbifer marinus]|uniref:FimV N-terminal domain-containing protein n=1 Tax=Microbulbifer marinus TaxID=658218 RepID=A0A1H3XBD8_9GAMM|nr:FimV/HubP family polar landmark protein [Microbulbifer marinus]SDZ96633.1 FimV N-terminal domain-containing protein [Microbulbifer marinus]
MDLHQTLPTTSRLATLFALILQIPLILASASSLALGLGNASLKTAIGYPLTVEIPILDRSASLNVDQVRVRQVLGRSAEQMGYDLAADAKPFMISVSELSGGLTIQVKSPAPLHEPLVSFLLELSWPGGTIYRDYNLLVDLPSAAPPTATAAPAQNASPAVQPPAPAEAAYTGKQWRVAPGQSLWLIARRVQPDSSIPLDAVMAAIHARNPHAFLNGDMNRLRTGALLDLPSAADYSAPPAVASRPAAAPGPAEREPSPSIADSVSPAVPAEEKPQGRLRLSGSPAETGGSRAVRLQEEIDVVKEQLDKVNRENEQLRQQIKRIETSEYLATMQEMLQLQEQRITELKAELRTSAATTAAEGSADATSGDISAVVPPAPVIVRDAGPSYATLLLLILTGIAAGVALSQLQDWWQKRRMAADAWPERLDPLTADWAGEIDLPDSLAPAPRETQSAPDSSQPAIRSAIFPPPAPELDGSKAKVSEMAAADGEEEGQKSAGSPATDSPDSLFEELQLDESFGQDSADLSAQGSPLSDDDLVLDIAASDQLPQDETDPAAAESAPGAAERSNDDLVLDFTAFDPLPLDEMEPVAVEPAPGAAESSDDELLLDFAAIDPLPLDEIDPVAVELAPGAAESSDDELVLDFAAIDQLPLDEIDPLAAEPAPGTAESSDADVKKAVNEAVI